jgi:hypothetical protein
MIGGVSGELVENKGIRKQNKEHGVLKGIRQRIVYIIFWYIRQARRCGELRRSA